MSSPVWWIASVSPILILAVLLKAKTVLRFHGDELRGKPKLQADGSDNLEFNENVDDHLPPNVIRGKWLL